MTLQQGLAFAVVLGMMALFVWGRLRYDLVGMFALFVSVLVGIVPAEEAFSGFSDDIIIIVASALVVSAAVARSGIVEMALRPHRPVPFVPSAWSSWCSLRRSRSSRPSSRTSARSPC